MDGVIDTRWTRLRLPGAFLALVLAGLTVTPRATEAHDCGTVNPCPAPPPPGQTPPTCYADCTETDFRRAVHVVNTCGGDRIIKFFGPSCTGAPGAPTVIDMKQEDATCSGNVCVGGVNAGQPCSSTPQCRIASCGPTGVGVGNAVCLFGNRMTIDGENKVLFNYVKPTTGDPLDGACCSGACGAEKYRSALFTFAYRQGEETVDNTVRNFTMQFFPEGIHVRRGRRHRW
jgi:hypothetical protein